MRTGLGLYMYPVMDCVEYFPLKMTISLPKGVKSTHIRCKTFPEGEKDCSCTTHQQCAPVTAQTVKESLKSCLPGILSS